MVLSKYSKI